MPIMSVSATHTRCTVCVWQWSGMIRWAPVRCCQELIAKPAERTRLVTNSPQSWIGDLGVLFLPGFHRARPVISEQAPRGAVGQHLAAGLAARAVIDFILRVADALN